MAQLAVTAKASDVWFDCWCLPNVIFHLSYLPGACQTLTASATVIRVNVSAISAGAVASYECVAGYTLVGSSTRTHVRTMAAGVAQNPPASVSYESGSCR